MSTFFFVIITIAALATLAVLIRGVLMMASGKQGTAERQNKLMVQRVILQAVTIVLVIVFLMFMGVGR